ncbi:MAG: hypothetical protein LBH55_04145 [Mycoplasmataceae bacterium]|nr:hypothetical protein [Mycoplasmataceae bacterium]
MTNHRFCNIIFGFVALVINILTPLLVYFFAPDFFKTLNHAKNHSVSTVETIDTALLLIWASMGVLVNILNIFVAFKYKMFDNIESSKFRSAIICINIVAINVFYLMMWVIDKMFAKNVKKPSSTPSTQTDQYSPNSKASKDAKKSVVTRTRKLSKIK